MIAQMLLSHVTLATGHVATHRLDTISADALAACRALLPDGGKVPGFAAFWVDIHGPVFTVFRGREPLVVCAVGTGPDATWGDLVGLQERFALVKASAPSNRWLGVVILPGLAMLAQNDVGWLGDFERCLAAALLLPAQKRN